MIKNRLLIHVVMIAALFQINIAFPNHIDERMLVLNTEMDEHTCPLGMSAPRVIKEIVNYDIVEGNVAMIKAAPSFSGDKLTYAVFSQPKSKKNRVTIDQQTGMIRINAITKDLFDVTVTAKNSCGYVSTTFNVEIDEET